MSDFDNDNQRSDHELILRGKAISEDGRGFICLDDIWETSGEPITRKPVPWKNTPSAKALIAALQIKIRKSDINFPEVIYSRRGRGQRGTYAHPILAAAYAGYLKPALEIEVREIWLRYRAGDATLADDILQRASAEANHWAGVRALARSQRRGYTDVLKTHDVQDKGYMECTEAVYLHLLGGKSWQIRERMGLPKKANIRDALDATNLAFITAAEALSAERIEEEDRRGNRDCAEASAISASVIRTAIETDRRSRQKRMLG